MKYSYKVILKVEVFHEFFGGAAFPFVDFVPSPATLKVFRNHNMIFKKSSNGFELGMPASADQEEINESINTCFSFQITDPYWTNYTAIAHSFKEGGAYLLSNLSGGDQLTRETYLSSSDSVHCVFTTGFKIKNEGQTELVAIASGSGENVKCPVKVLSEEESIMGTSVLDEGLYTLQELANTSFFKSEMPVETGVCQLLISPDLLNGESAVYKVVLKADEVFYKYYFPVNSIKNLANVGIVNEKDEQVFDNGEEITVGTKPMRCFTSLNNYKYTNLSQEIFRLKKNLDENGNKGVTILKQLPMPSKSTLFRRDDEGNKVMELFVNM